MILKVEFIKGGGGWTFIDGVDSILVENNIEKDPDGMPYESRTIRLFRDKLAFDSVTVSGNQQAYLLTGDGKTIERLN